MLNPDLQKEIDLEIDNAPEDIRNFLRDKYFTDTMTLIERVNKLTPEQSESIELEVIMSLLGISDYADIVEAIKKEGGLATDGEVRQVAKDLKDYIFEKLNPQPIMRIDKSAPASEPLRNIIYDAYGKEMLGPKVLDYYEDKRSHSKPEESNVSVDNQNVPTIKNSDVSYDVYRELPEEDDKIMKREVDIHMGEGQADDIIKSN